MSSATIRSLSSPIARLSQGFAARRQIVHGILWADDPAGLVFGFGLRASGFGLRASGFGLRAGGFGLRAFGLRASGFGLRAPGFRLWASAPAIGLRAAGFGSSGS